MKIQYDIRISTAVIRCRAAGGPVFRSGCSFVCYLVTLISLVLPFGGCVRSGKLQQNQYLLYSQTIRGVRTIPSTDLEALIPQKPNSRILRLPITPGLWFYQIGARKYNREAVQKELEAKIQEKEQLTQQANSGKSFRKQNKKLDRQIARLRRKAEEGNWVMRSLGSPPAYFQEADAKQNAAKMQRYLYNKGFFDGNVTFSVDTLSVLGRRVRVNYTVTENIPAHFKTVTYQIADPRVDSIVRLTLSRSLLKSGERYDADKVNNERARIEELLRNNGYYNFTRQYIPLPLDVKYATPEYSPDSTYRNLNIWVRIANPPGKTRHPVYTIGEIDVRIARAEDRFQLDTIRYNGIRFLMGRQTYSTRLLDSRILLRTDSLYRLRNFQETQRQLFTLNQFGFANINFTDTTNQRLRTRINLTPIDKYEVSAESGLYVLYQSQSGYPGPFGSLTFRTHNVFGGLGTFETTARFGIEAQTGFTASDTTGSKAYFAQEFGLNTSLIFPHILFPGKTRFVFSKANPRTQISLGYNFTNRPDYRRSNFRTVMAYNWLKRTNHQYSFSIADISFLQATIKSDAIGSEFRRFLDQQAALGSTIKNSFLPAFASSINFTYTYNTNIVGRNQRANFLRVAVESGGTTLNFFKDETLKRIFNPDAAAGTGLQYYKYLRTNIDFRHYIPLKTHTTLAFRVNTGMVFGYGSNKTAPYEKLFFAGGSNSIRAWLPRRLGPGSAIPFAQEDQLLPTFNPKRQEQYYYLFEQPGDILLESSVELRGRLFHLGADINGAFFVDAGNVWALRENPQNPRLGATFYLPGRTGTDFFNNHFTNQIAVGTGVGLRIDFSFFIIRLDGAVKVFDPARRYIDEDTGNLVDKRFFLPYFRFDRMFSGANPLVINFGIGYPF